MHRGQETLGAQGLANLDDRVYDPELNLVYWGTGTRVQIGTEILGWVITFTPMLCWL
ncbi:MAG: hypothetical protein Ct9H300mP15_12330 [Gemmatimonadota bacterium]|nr:MAG: hypothetical protein Ct9H300mP15_12330 [Gemmatimonadota bacterium]